MAGLARCLAGRHERAEARIERGADDRLLSRCRFCRAPLQRRAKRDWVRLSRRDYRALRRPGRGGGDGALAG
jgi:hypothetical protein